MARAENGTGCLKRNKEMRLGWKNGVPSKMAPQSASKGDLGPENALTEMASSFPVVTCSVALLCLAGWIPKNKFILLTSTWFHSEEPGRGILPL